MVVYQCNRLCLHRFQIVDEPGCIARSQYPRQREVGSGTCPGQFRASPLACSEFLRLLKEELVFFVLCPYNDGLENARRGHADPKCSF